MNVNHDVLPGATEPTRAQRALLEARLQHARRNAQAGTAGRASIPRRAAVERIPLSFAQERLWFLDQLEPGNAVYNLCQAVRLRGPLNVAALEQALNDIVQRHEILRTNFVASEGRPQQVIAATRTLPVTTREVAAGEVTRCLANEARRPFDLAHDLLIRALVVKQAPDDHTLMLTMHHIVSDGWSVGVLFEELAALYAARAQGRAPTLPELPVQFADVVLWERAQVKERGLQESLAFWKRQLGGELPVIELPADRPRSLAKQNRGAVETLELPASLVEELKTLSRREGVTLFMTLLAAFEVLLHRWTGQTDIVVGSVAAGRRKVEVEGLIGFFVNTVVFRENLTANPSFLDLLRQVRETALGTEAHQDVPFDRLVKELRPDRGTSRNPLFQVMFVLQNAAALPSAFPQLSVEPVAVDTGTAKFDLTAIVAEVAGGLRSEFEYNADLFDRATVARLLRSFHTLLESAVADPQRRIGELEILTASERQELLVTWNQTRTDYPRTQTIAGLFEAQARRAPDAVALCSGAVRVTYGELNARANQLARRLRALGVGEGTLVALCLERSVEMIVALLGIVKAGGAYVSLDPSYPAERLAFMVADSRAQVVLTARGSERALALDHSTSAAHLLRLDTDWLSIARESAENLGELATAESLAYVSYTSGSTGRPKGVAVAHRGVIRLVVNTNYIELTSADAVAQISNCAFDASTFEIWGALLNGARLVILPLPVVLSPSDFAAAIAANGVTTVLVTTALFNQLAMTAPGFFRPLRNVVFGGEAANANAVRAVLAAGAPGRLINAYGPTEATTITTAYDVREVAADALTIPIGRPIANTTVYVLDAHLQPVPVGVPGELFVGGDALARGYLRRPELDAERFIADPFSAESGARLYRTGDRVRWRSDGMLEFLGRFDDQVKLRGFRIELPEIELALCRHPRVKEAVVLVKAAADGDRQLVAYVVADGAGLEAAELRRHLEASLPEAMVPALYVMLPALPLNANGKVNRAALPTPGAPARTGEGVAPRDEVERGLAEIWRRVLGVAQVGVQEGFFDLGGHSLLAVQMVAEVEKAFGRKLPVAAIFQRGTIEQLAALLRPEADTYHSASSIVEIQGRGQKPPLYLVHGVGGGMFWGYANLARHLGSNQPVLAFKSRALEGLPEWTSIEEMAKHYVADLRQHQPRGPYRLGGYCFGGIVAYEMARQLKADGAEVEMLALISCSPPNSAYERAPEHRTWGWKLKFARNLAYWLGCFVCRWTVKERVEFVRWKVRVMRNKVLKRWQAGAAVPGTDVDQMVNLGAYTEEQRRLWQTHVQSLRTYVPQPYNGRLTLFRTGGHPLRCSFDRHYGWGALAQGGVTVRVVPGGHGNILKEPHVRAVARELELALQPARPGVAPFIPALAPN